MLDVQVCMLEDIVPIAFTAEPIIVLSRSAQLAVELFNKKVNGVAAVPLKIDITSRVFIVYYDLDLLIVVL